MGVDPKFNDLFSGASLTNISSNSSQEHKLIRAVHDYRISSNNPSSDFDKKVLGAALSAQYYKHHPRG